MTEADLPKRPWQVYALRYGHHSRPARDNFIFNNPPFDLHDGAMPLDFFIWALVGGDPHGSRTIVVDLGYDHAGAARRGREIFRLPSEALGMLDIDPASVEDVVITHLHYDHCGNLADFPRARIYLQDREMAFATGRFMSHTSLRLAFDVEYVTQFVRAVYDERVVFIDGSQTIAPGVSVHHIGGHTDGLQVVRVWTDAGWLVLASDAVHLYANMASKNPFPIVHDVGAMIDGFATLERLADHRELIVPGHDPLVFDRFPCPDDAHAGELLQLDGGPVKR